LPLRDGALNGLSKQELQSKREHAVAGRNRPKPWVTMATGGRAERVHSYLKPTGRGLSFCFLFAIFHLPSPKFRGSGEL
jgi:hypothetical protein